MYYSTRSVVLVCEKKSSRQQVAGTCYHGNNFVSIPGT